MCFVSHICAKTADIILPSTQEPKDRLGIDQGVVASNARRRFSFGGRYLAIVRRGNKAANERSN